jgi:hypothetical protein
LEWVEIPNVRSDRGAHGLAVDLDRALVFVDS